MTITHTPERGASQSALTAAAARAAHLIVDAEPVIFADPLAERLLGPEAEPLIAYHRLHGDHPILAGARAQVTLRSRVAEGVLATAVGNTITQYVLLGAGLDSFAHRTEHPGLRVFEVDHPASQDDKRRRAAAAGLAEPATLTYVPLDLENGELSAALAAGGFDPRAPAVVAWLGVTMYLTDEAVAATLEQLGRFAPGSTLVCDYILAPDLRDDAGRLYAEQVGAMSAERGEPWRATFAPEELTTLLGACGFADVRHLDQRDSAPAGVWQRADALSASRLSVLAVASRR